ncbi:MAG: hypothetical protein VB041_05230, partial [Candidatus Limiplasma sp.]|nr:hypothetical protein [Candidatus Limiplasma sp.]
LPSPVAKYAKLTVDESAVQKYDLLYPLTPERYAEIKNQIEDKLTAEASHNQKYLDAAWQAAVKNMESLFKSIAERSAEGVTCEIQVIRDDRLSQPTETPDGMPEPTVLPAA